MHRDDEVDRFDCIFNVRAIDIANTMKYIHYCMVRIIHLPQH